MPFEKGAAYTRAQIHAVFGGSRRAALVTKGRTVVCLCLTRERNPRAPGEAAIAGQGRPARLGRELAASGAAVPVFVRASRGAWEYAGARRVRGVVEEPDAPPAEGEPAGGALALLLEEVPPVSGTAPPPGASSAEPDADGGAGAAPENQCGAA